MVFLSHKVLKNIMQGKQVFNSNAISVCDNLQLMILFTFTFVYGHCGKLKPPPSSSTEKFGESLLDK